MATGARRAGGYPPLEEEEEAELGWVTMATQAATLGGLGRQNICALSTRT